MNQRDNSKNRKLLNFIYEENFEKNHDVFCEIIYRVKLGRRFRKNVKNFMFGRQLPYQIGSTSSRSITEVKQFRARSVLGWVTAWEHRV